MAEHKMSAVQINEIIAEFDGWESNRYFNLPERMHKTVNGEELAKPKNQLDYDSNWNSLMKIVSEIEKIQLQPSVIPVRVEINGNTCIIHRGEWGEGRNGFISRTSDKQGDEGKKEAIFQAVAEFLVWYKTKK